MTVEIPDDDLAGFSAQAKKHLQDALRAYGSDLIDEANRVEAGHRPAKGDPEVTGAMVDNAKVVVLGGLRSPKQSVWLRILRVLAAVLSLVVGIMYDPAKLQDGGYMLLFVVAIAVTILLVTLSAIKE